MDLVASDDFRRRANSPTADTGCGRPSAQPTWPASTSAVRPRLRDGAEPGPAGPARTVFVMGRNEWRDAQDWPLPEATVQRMWLHSSGNANTFAGDGLLSFESPAASEPADTFVFDPLDPVQSMGGPARCRRLAGLPGWNAGPYDQREVEARRDVLCYTSVVLSAPLEVIGPIELVLYAASSALDTDFTAKLVDVWPSGRAENLTDGILRARYRESLSEPTPLVPGKTTEFRIAVGPTAHVFLPGHRVRLEVSSSNFPRFDPNTNTGGDLAIEGREALRSCDKRRLSRAGLAIAPPASGRLPLMPEGAGGDTGAPSHDQVIVAGRAFPGSQCPVQQPGAVPGPCLRQRCCPLRGRGRVPQLMSASPHLCAHMPTVPGRPRHKPQPEHSTSLWRRHERQVLGPPQGPRVPARRSAVFGRAPEG